MREAKAKGDEYYDQGCRNWRTNLLSPTLAVDEALRRVAVGDNADSSTAGGSRT